MEDVPVTKPPIWGDQHPAGTGRYNFVLIKHSPTVTCAMVKSRYIGDKLIPPLIGILVIGI